MSTCVLPAAAILEAGNKLHLHNSKEKFATTVESAHKEASNLISLLLNPDADPGEIKRKYAELDGKYKELFPDNRWLEKYIQKDLSKLSDEDLEQLLEFLEEIKTRARDDSQKTVQQMYLDASLYMAITNILIEMSKSNCRANERRAQQVGR